MSGKRKAIRTDSNGDQESSDDQEEISECAESYDDEDDSSEGATSDSTLNITDEEVQVDFEARQVSENDFHGVRRLLQQLFLKAHVDLSALTSLVLSQSDIGSVIKAAANSETGRDDAEMMEENKEEEKEEEEEEEEEDALTITTALNLLSKEPCVKELTGYLTCQSSKHAPAMIHKHFTELLSGCAHAVTGVGFVIHERFLNIPVEVGPPLLSALLHELQQHTSLKFSHLIFITRCHMSTDTAQSSRKRKKKGAAKSVATTASGWSGGIVYDYQEMECLVQVSELSFSYPVTEDSDSVLAGSWSYDDVAMAPYRTVFVLTKDQFYHAVQSAVTLYRTDND